MPRAASNDVEDAVFLSSHYGLTPDQWQESVLAGWLGLRRDDTWSAPRCGLAVPRQNGKNAILEIRELHGLVTLGERFLHTAHEVKTARKAFTRLASFFENERRYPELARLVAEIRRTNGQEAIVLTNGASVEFVARSKGSGRGFSVDVLVMDEAQELSEDALAALLPTISASANPQQIMTGTPPGPTAVGEVFTRVRNAGVKAADPRLCWMEWSCLGSDDLDEKAHWAAANPALGLRLRVETIGDERAAMDEETFARERLGVWSEMVGEAVIPAELWAACSDPESFPLDPVAFALDITPDRSVASIALAGRRADGLLHLEVAENRGGTAWVVDRLAQMVAQWSPCAVVLDARGAAASLVPELDKRGVATMTTNSSEMAAACGAFHDHVVNGQLRYRERLGLSASLAGARKRPLGDAWAWHRRNAGADLSPLVSATLALWGFTAKRPVDTDSRVIILRR